jgi:hypothetical protein
MRVTAKLRAEFQSGYHEAYGVDLPVEAVDVLITALAELFGPLALARARRSSTDPARNALDRSSEQTRG